MSYDSSDSSFELLHVNPPKTNRRKQIKKKEPKKISSSNTNAAHCKVINKQMCQFVERPLKDYLCFFITGDILVELTRPEDLVYEAQAAQLWNLIKPLSFIHHDLKRKRLHLNFETSTPSLPDFKFLVKMMQSMQDAQYYQYSLLLENLLNEIDQYKQEKRVDDSVMIQLKHLEFQNFQNNELPAMIDEITKNHQFYNLAVYSCIEGLDRKCLTQFTLSEKAIEVINGSVETYKQQLQRNGWREHVELDQRRSFSQFQIKQLQRMMGKVNKKDSDFKEDLKVRAPTFVVRTTDGFDATLEVNEVSLVKYFGDEIIGIVNVFLYKIDQDFLDSINSYRNISKMADDSSQTLQQMNRYDMNQFEYILEAEKFIEKYNLS